MRILSFAFCNICILKCKDYTLCSDCCAGRVLAFSPISLNFRGFIKLARFLLSCSWTVVLCRGASCAWNNVIFCSLLVSQPNSAAVLYRRFFLAWFSGVFLPDISVPTCCFCARNSHMENVEARLMRLHSTLVSKKGCI